MPNWIGQPNNYLFDMEELQNFFCFIEIRRAQLFNFIWSPTSQLPCGGVHRDVGLTSTLMLLALHGAEEHFEIRMVFDYIMHAEK